MHTQAIQATACTHWQPGTYRHAHMHKLTCARLCATASACLHASACAQARMHYTLSLSLSLSLSLTHTHTHTRTNTFIQTHVNKHCICVHTRILTPILTNTFKHRANSPPRLVREWLKHSLKAPRVGYL